MNYKEQYERESIVALHNKLLSGIDDKYEKNVGTFVYDLLKAIALGGYTLEKQIENLYSKLDINNLSGDELDRFVWQRKGLKRKQAKVSTGVVTVEGNGNIKVGDLFETESGTQFRATETKAISTSGDVKIEAVVPGQEGNVGSGLIKYIPVTISGIAKVTNTNPTTDGYTIESDISLRERYLIEVQKPATSGNRYHYLQWAREIVGVGDAKVHSTWNGPNTVKVIIIDQNKLPGTPELVKRVQEYIDPKGDHDSTWGAGYGEAPIGAYCTVESATPKTINVALTIVKGQGELLNDLKGKVEKICKSYFREIAFKKDSISYAILGSLILDIEGIDDWKAFTLNGDARNVLMSNTEVPILGSVVLSE